LTLRELEFRHVQISLLELEARPALSLSGLVISTIFALLDAWLELVRLGR